MTRSDPRVRRGAHRAYRDATSALVPSLVAILAVTALITALYVWRGEDDLPSQATAATTDALAAAGPSAGATSTAASTAEAIASSPSATGASPSGTPKSAATRSGAAASSSAATSAATSAVTQAPTVAVVVLNQTSRSGLASVVADRLRGRGWSVAGVGNFRGSVPATTVYYPAGAQAQAQAAARHLPTPVRIRPRFGNLSTTRLTIVLTSNYPS
jgi:hypothetical protein